MWGKNRKAISATRHEIHSNTSRMSPQLVISFWPLENLHSISKLLEWKSSDFREARALQNGINSHYTLSQHNRLLILLLGCTS